MKERKQIAEAMAEAIAGLFGLRGRGTALATGQIWAKRLCAGRHESIQLQQHLQQRFRFT